MTEAQDAAAVRTFPPAIPVGLILVGVMLNCLFPLEPGIALPAPARYWIGGTLALAAIGGLGAWAVVLLRKDGQSENPWKPTFRIIDKGPFRITRNPMYLQMVIVCFAAGIAMMNWWIFLFTPVCAVLLHYLAILPEEAYLARKFGDTYLSYKAKTRRWL